MTSTNTTIKDRYPPSWGLGLIERCGRERAFRIIQERINTMEEALNIKHPLGIHIWDSTGNEACLVPIHSHIFKGVDTYLSNNPAVLKELNESGIVFLETDVLTDSPNPIDGSVSRLLVIRKSTNHDLSVPWVPFLLNRLKNINGWELKISPQLNDGETK